MSDLLAITDAVEARDDIDAERTAAMGGSFGGYMANWVAGHTDRFRAIAQGNADFGQPDGGVHRLDIAAETFILQRSAANPIAFPQALFGKRIHVYSPSFPLML